MISEDKIERKVTVILATDVVGYSTQMEKNENQTLQTLKTCRSIIDSLIADHHGRIFQVLWRLFYVPLSFREPSRNAMSH